MVTTESNGAAMDTGILFHNAQQGSSVAQQQLAEHLEAKPDHLLWLALSATDNNLHSTCGIRLAAHKKATIAQKERVALLGKNPRERQACYRSLITEKLEKATELRASASEDIMGSVARIAMHSPHKDEGTECMRALVKLATEARFKSSVLSHCRFIARGSSNDAVAKIAYDTLKANKGINVDVAKDLLKATAKSVSRAAAQYLSTP